MADVIRFGVKKTSHTAPRATAKVEAMAELREMAKHPAHRWTHPDCLHADDLAKVVATGVDPFCIAPFCNAVRNAAERIVAAQAKGPVSDRLVQPFAAAVEALVRAVEVEEPHLVFTLCHMVEHGLFSAGRQEDPVAQKLANAVEIGLENAAHMEFPIYQARDFLNEAEMAIYEERIRPLLEIAFTDWRTLPDEYHKRRTSGYYDRPDASQGQLFAGPAQPKPLPSEDITLYAEWLKQQAYRPYCSTAISDG